MHTHIWPRVDRYIVCQVLGVSQSRRLYVCTAAVPVRTRRIRDVVGRKQSGPGESYPHPDVRVYDRAKRIKEEVAVQQNELVRLTAKRSRQDRPYAFRRTGNAAQYRFVEDVVEHVREAFWQLEKVDGPKAEAAAKELKEAEALLTRRMIEDHL